MNWFDVDKNGLAKLLERRGKSFALFELISNAWDSKATRVNVNLAPVEGRPAVAILMEDDDPNGFADLSHAWTLFAESTRKGDAEKRGRFNLGEKLVLALCSEAEICSVSGAVSFDEKGRHTLRKRRSAGSAFSGLMRMTREELRVVENDLMRILAPIPTTITVDHVIHEYGQLGGSAPDAVVEATLPTELADAEGILRRTARKTTVAIYEPSGGNAGPGWIYEMGIPVVETGDCYHVDVRQKVPLNMDRDNVTPGYLRELRVLALNAMAPKLIPAEATKAWVRDATGHPSARRETVDRVMDLRFGSKRVAYDPSDPEANKIAVSKGYEVVSGGSLSADEWANVKRDDAIRPAGKVTPSPKPFHPDGEPLKLLDPKDWHAAMLVTVERFQRIAPHLINHSIDIRIADDPEWGFKACYGRGQLTMNAAALPADFWTCRTDQNKLLIHELAHETASDHLSQEFHRECCRLGAVLAELAHRDDEVYR